MTIELTDSKRAWLELNALFTASIAHTKLYMIYGEEIFKESKETYLEAFKDMFEDVKASDLLDVEEFKLLNNHMDAMTKELLESYGINYNGSV